MSYANQRAVFSGINIIQLLLGISTEIILSGDLSLGITMPQGHLYPGIFLELRSCHFFAFYAFFDKNTK